MAHSLWVFGLCHNIEMADLNQYLYKVLDVAPIPIVGWDKVGKIIYWNKRAEMEFGWEEGKVLGENVKSLVGISLRGEMLDVPDELSEDDISVVHKTIISTKKEKRIFEWTSLLFPSYITSIYGLSMAKDISRIKVLQERMKESHRLASMGRILGQISHEINNIMTVIEGYLSLAFGETEGKEGHEDIVAALDALLELQALMKNTLSLLRQPAQTSHKCRINKLIKELVEFSRKILPGEVDLRVILSKEDPEIKCNDMVLHHILLNLILNARDALNGKGSILIKTDAIENSSEESRFDESRFNESGNFSDGKYAVIAVTDTGLGMTDEVKDRIFEPFYTTKERSGGTGLGLFFVHESVKELGGWIDVESGKGKGSTFTIFLPFHKSSLNLADAGFL
ncbi:PAS domain S-box protein [candidate division WOR-3 bacterium]|nr:PAS domain S-box protein [candidate division WOR-3 bacterium]